MRKLIIITAIIVVCLSISVKAETSTEFTRGVEFYNTGQYDSALTVFQTIENEGIHNSELFFNLGNCYFKTDQRGLAIACYMKAERLVPRDDDIKANLKFVQSTLRDKYADSLQNPIWNFIKSSSLNFHDRELTWFLLIIYLLIIAIIIYLTFFKIKNVPLLIVLFVLIFIGLVGSSMLAINVKMNYYSPQAVIVEPEVSVLAGPGAISDVRFTAHEGLTFRILKQESGYYEGIFANRLKGWVEISKAYQF